MGGAGGNAGQPADLLEREAAPEVGDDDFAFLDRQRFQGGGRSFAVEARRFPPGRTKRAGGRPRSVSWRRRRRSERAAVSAPLRTTRKSQAAGSFGGGRWAASLTNASCTTSSAAAHHCRANSVNAAA